MVVKSRVLEVIGWREYVVGAVYSRIRITDPSDLNIPLLDGPDERAYPSYIHT